MLVIGDSVVNGGAYTDQDELATALLQQRLRHDLSCPVLVGNISAGSWGPQNELGYLDEFGLFDADVVVMVESSHDARDEIGPLPAGLEVEPRPYHFAIAEAWDRVRGVMPTPIDAPPANNETGRPGPCLAAMGQMIDRVRAAGATPIVVFHYESSEVAQAAEADGHRMLREACEAHGVTPIVSLKERFRDAVAGGHDPYREHDAIHPNAFGQRLLADVLAPAVEQAIADRSTPPISGNSPTTGRAER